MEQDFDRPDERFDMKKVEEEIITTSKTAVLKNASIGAFVLECTDLPPFAAKISKVTGLPVFDFVTMVGHVAIALGEIRMY